MSARHGFARMGIVSVVATAGIASGQCFASAEPVAQLANPLLRTAAADVAQPVVAPWDNVGQGRGTDFEPGTNGVLSDTVIKPEYFPLVDQRRRELLSAATLDGAADGAAIGGIGGAAVGATVGAITGLGTGLAAVPIGAGIGAGAGLVIGGVGAATIGTLTGMALGCVVGLPAVIVGCIPGAVIGGIVGGVAGTIAGAVVGPLAGTAIGAGAGAGVATAAGLGTAAVATPVGAAIGAGLGAAIGAATAASQANQGLAQQNLNDLEGFAYTQRQDAAAPVSAAVEPVARQLQQGLTDVSTAINSVTEQFQLVR